MIEQQRRREELSYLPFGERVQAWIAINSKSLMAAGLIAGAVGLLVIVSSSRGGRLAEKQIEGTSGNNSYTFATIPSPTPTPTKAELLEKRRLFCNLQERSMLDKGFDFDLSLKGKAQDELVVKYVLINRVFVYQFQRDYPDFIPMLGDLGFRKAHFTDGFNETWTFDVPGRR